MLYVWHLTIPANTAKASLVEEKQKIHKGVITRIEVFMPAGCHGMVHATVSHNLSQLLPFNPDESVACDDKPVDGRYFWEVKDSEPALILRGWSPDTYYSHVVTVRVTVLPKSVATFAPLIDLLTKFFQRIGVIK